MANYLLEIGTEEIPAKFMPGALRQMQELAGKLLTEARINYGKITSWGTPRRLALIISDLAEKGQDIQEEVRGPAKKAAFDEAGNYTKAAQGFARSQGVSVESLYVKEVGNGEYLFAKKELEGRKTAEVLPELAVQLITSLNFPKPMRWGDKEMRFARPIRWLVSLLDDQVIPFEIEDLTADRISRGHRFLGQQEIRIEDPTSYEKQLEENYVMVDHVRRQAECWKQIQEVAASNGGIVEEDEELLAEINQLVEWPTALLGSFDENYLVLPEEVIITPMQEHQRYFPVRGQDGKLLAKFITVRNGNAEHLDIVTSGNEKVLKARLDDARFFWDEDRKLKLAEYLPRLEKVVFQESLGTVAQKVERIMQNTDYLTTQIAMKPEQKADSLRAAQLAKADLVTSMVYEFTELQGVMGRYYAQHSGEKDKVAQAIMEHYQPRFAGDVVPDSLEGALVSIADKIDTIAGCFAIGIEPTGSQDPYALRRQAMGICLILIKHNLQLGLAQLISTALNNYQGILPEEALGQKTQEKILEFFQARLKNILTDEGHNHDVVDAVLAVDYSVPVLVLARAQALTDLREDADFRDLLTSFTRAANLAKKAEGAAIQPQYFVELAEKDLYQALGQVEEKVAELLSKADYVAALKAMATLSKPIEAFFEAVMVMDKDEIVRNNRLGLLVRIVSLTQNVGDLSKIVVN
ncbi:MAG: glycine--tRNA ligase subunit beta [Peptococcia bacterium]